MPLAASILAAFIPMVTYLYLIYKMDKYEPEPIKFIILHFAWGSLGAVIFGIIGSLMLSLLTGFNGNGETEHAVQTIFFAPLSEELGKGLFLFASVNSKKFDNITDGIIYGAAIGLGFGMTENFMYFVSYGIDTQSWISIVVIRSLFSAVMHGISTGTLGAFLGISKYSNLFGRITLPFIGISIAIFIHFMWNASVSFNGTVLFGFLFMIALIIIFISVIKISVKNEKKIIERELLEEADLGIIPIELIPILSTHQRFTKGWMDESIRKIYFRSVVRLAFSKMKYKKVKDGRKSFYLNEINYYREFIRMLIKNNSEDKR